MSKKSIVQFSIDEAYAIGNENDTVYIQVAQYRRKWYVTCVIDSETGHFVMDYCTDDGPYDTEKDALGMGVDVALTWIADNNVIDWEYDSRLESFGWKN